jgi:ABC-2 type transport system ATP-binding protein
MQPVIQLDRVSKSFSGRRVVEHLSFTVRQGEVFALLGPNGAGKTTTVRMLIGVIRPDEGRITVTMDGQSGDVLPADATGYLPEDRGLYRDIPILRTLVYFGRLHGLEKDEANRRALDWLERLQLLDRKDDRVDALSKGNQQRVQLIATLIHRPAIAMLDEPFTGLDPLSQEFFLGLVSELREAGTTIILSAHQMDLVERAADRVLLMNDGREILSGSVGELHGRLDARPRIRLTFDGGITPDALRDDPDVDDVVLDSGAAQEVHVTLRQGVSVAPFVARAMGRGDVRGISTEPPRLHDIFVRAVRDDDDRRGRGAR